MLHIYAPNIFSGGGFTLLKKIVDSNADNVKNLFFHIDERYPNGSSLALSNQSHRIVKKGFLSHILYEYRLSKLLKKEDRLLSFSNRPLLFKPECLNLVFLQNFYIFISDSEYKVNWRMHLKYFFIRLMIKRVAANRNVLFIVQNYVMKSSLVDIGIKESKIHILPFFHEMVSKSTISEKSSHKKFIYPAAGVSHKNHHMLIKAWLIYKENTSDDELHLTLESNYWDSLKKKLNLSTELVGKLKIINHGFLSQDQLSQLYRKVDCLIYPSLFESFGLPLIEAAQLDIDIVAAELDYVRDLPINISETFEPNSAISISRAIQRYVGCQASQLNVLSVDQFIDELKFSNS